MKISFLVWLLVLKDLRLYCTANIFIWKLMRTTPPIWWKIIYCPLHVLCWLVIIGHLNDCITFSQKQSFIEDAIYYIQLNDWGFYTKCNAAFLQYSDLSKAVHYDYWAASFYQSNTNFDKKSFAIFHHRACNRNHYYYLKVNMNHCPPNKGK